MSKAEENRKLLKIKLLEARLKSYYGRVQALQDIASKLDASNSKKVQHFLDSAANLTVLRKEFNDEFDELNLIKMELNAEAEPNMTLLECFENLFVMVQSKVNACSNQGKAADNGPSIKPYKIKLPPIELIKFNGNAKSWSMFIECFNNTIHNNAQLSNSEKVYYLCGQLTDRALECVAGITPTGDNYKLIYDTLMSKFDDVRSMGTAYLDEIMNVKKMQYPSVDGLNSFIDKFSVSVSAFNKLDIPSKLDFVFLYLALRRVDSETARLYENSVREEKMPSYESFAKFVREQAKIIERTGAYTPCRSSGMASSGKIPVPTNIKTTSTRAFVTSSAECPVCKNVDHENFSRCVEFLKLSAKERFNVVKQHHGCVLCLSFYHQPNACNIKGSCTTCHSKTHHALLHFVKEKPSTSLPVSSGKEKDSLAEACVEDIGSDDAEEINSDYVGVSLCSSQSPTTREPGLGSISSTVLLATARVRFVDASGNAHSIRCLIDNGSQNHFITERCCGRLSLVPRPFGSPISVNGFGGSSNPVVGETELEFFSRFDRSRPYRVRPLVVKNITQRLPTAVIDKSMLSYLKGVPLADDAFDRPGQIDMIIGAQLFSRLMLSKRIFGPPGRPDAMQTKLGFVLMGEAPVLEPATRTHTSVFCAFTEQRIDEVIRSSGELEEVSSCTFARLSREEQEREQSYKLTTERDAADRYIVALPFKSDPTDIGDSLPMAERRFLALEKKLMKFPQLRDAYDEVKEHLRDDYMTPVASTQDVARGYVTPYNGVLRTDKITVKLRVVLDASERAFGVAVYLHIQSKNGIVFSLLCAKARVVPLKLVTLAWLELSGALLMLKLVKAVLLTYKSRWKINRIFALTDLTVTLHWIHSNLRRWKTCVANRMAQIHKNFDQKCLCHIAGKMNFAVCLSSVLTSAQLIEHPLWLNGPQWITQEINSWSVQPPLYQLAQRISSGPRLIRIAVYILRLARRIKSRGLLLVEEFVQADLAIIVKSYGHRWSLEYLHRLQTRKKLLTDSSPIEKGHDRFNNAKQYASVALAPRCNPGNLSRIQPTYKGGAGWDKIWYLDAALTAPSPII